MVAEHCEIVFDMILHFEAAQNFVAKHYESRFWHDIPLKCSSKIGCRTLCKWFLHDFSFKGGSTLGCRAIYEWNFDMFFHFMRFRNWLQGILKDFDLIFRLKADQNLVANLQNTVNEIFTWFFTLRRLNTWLQSTLKDFDTIFHFMVA